MSVPHMTMQGPFIIHTNTGGKLVYVLCVAQANLALSGVQWNGTRSSPCPPDHPPLRLELLHDLQEGVIHLLPVSKPDLDL